MREVEFKKYSILPDGAYEPEIKDCLIGILDFIEVETKYSKIEILRIICDLAVRRKYVTDQPLEAELASRVLSWLENSWDPTCYRFVSYAISMIFNFEMHKALTLLEGSLETPMNVYSKDAIKKAVFEYKKLHNL